MPVFAVDRELIRDGTYLIAEQDGVIIGGGGWSKRRALYGGDSSREDEDELLDPQREPARVRAFFVHLDWARSGIGRSIMAACERAIRQSGFRTVDIISTLAGAPLYDFFGYVVVERYDIAMVSGTSLPVAKMSKVI